MLRLGEIRLRNWKAYQSAHIAIPWAPNRPVAIVQGANGAGKTSILEAVALGLYGREGIGLVARARRGRQDASYDHFLERALHAGARGDDATMSVELVFEGSSVGRLSLQRVWYLSAAGRHHRDDEEVRIREGEDETLVLVPGDEQREAFVRDYVGEKLLPQNLAPFFLFDGEQVDGLAAQDLEAQVRTAVDTVLGAPLLRQTVQDLRTYARERRKESREADGELLGELRAEVAGYEAREDALEAVVEGCNAELIPLRSRRDDLVRKIGSLHGDSYASFKNLFETREALTRTRTAQQEELRRVLSVDLAFALCGEPLRQRALQQLAAEGLRDQWEAGLRTSEVKFQAFLEVLNREGPAMALEAKRLRDAWEAVWNTPPEGCGDERRHQHLGEADRLLVARHLEQVSHATGHRIAGLARDVQLTDVSIQDLEGQIARQRGLDDQSQALADDLRKIQEAIAELEAKHRVEVQALDALRLDLSPRKSELTRLIQKQAAAAPILRRADRAEAYATALEDMIEATTPSSLEALSADVSQAYKALAHKNLVSEVRISPSGDVSLLDASGLDVREMDASAGESQIFALALMAAIAAAAPAFPIIMDTPLARLDVEHRQNVIRHFANLDRQLLLLTHPAELSAADLQAIEAQSAGHVVVVNVVEDAGPVTHADTLPRSLGHGS